MDNTEHKLHAFREYHKKYKLVLLAKNNIAYRELGQLAASANKKNHTDIMPIYFTKFMQVMATIPSRGNHVSVLMHILGYLKHKLDSQDKVELLKWFEIYRVKQVTRITPLVLLQHHFQHHPNDYIAEQYYFSPFPSDLMHAV